MTNDEKVIGIEIVGTERKGFSFAAIFDNADIRTLADAQEFAKRVSKALNHEPVTTNNEGA